MSETGKGAGGADRQNSDRDMTEQGALARLSGTVTAVNDLLATICMNLAGIGLVILTVIFGWLVFGRYVLNSTPTWVEQVSLLLVVFIAFLGASAGIQEKTHLSVDVLTARLNIKAKAVVFILVNLTLIGFGLFLAIYGYKLVVFKWASKIPLIGWPEGLKVLPLFIGGVLISFFSLGHLLSMARPGWDRSMDFDPSDQGD